jgi:TorA maturation chaperone TorD
MEQIERMLIMDTKRQTADVATKSSETTAASAKANTAVTAGGAAGASTASETAAANAAVAGVADRLAWIARAEFYELLARTFSYAEGDAGRELAQALSDGSYVEAAREVCGKMGVVAANATASAAAVSAAAAAVDTDAVLAAADAIGAAYAGADSESLLHRVHAEYTRLFIGTYEPLISPYGGWWRAKREGKEPILFLSRECREVEQAMHAAGVGNRAGLKEPLDHIGCELEFLQYVCTVLAGLAPAQAEAAVTEETYDSFVAGHLRPFVADFADAVLAASGEPLLVFGAEMLKALSGAE